MPTPYLVGKSAGSGSNPLAITSTAAVNAGDKIIVLAQGAFNSGTSSHHITSVSDPNGNTYAVDASTNNGNNAGSSIASADSAAGIASGSTFNVTFDSALPTTGYCWIYGVSGLDAGHAITTAIAHGGSSVAPDSGASGLVSNDVFNIAVVALNGNVTETAGTGYTLLDNEPGTKSGSVEYGNATGQSSQAQDATFGTTGALWSISLAVYQVTSGAAPATITVGEATSTASAYGPTVTPGAATLATGVASSSPTAHGPTLSPGAVTLAVGVATSSPAAYGVTLSNVTTLSVGAASSTAQAFGPTLTPGAVTLAVGEASSTATAFGVGLGMTLFAGFASRTPTAYGPTGLGMQLFPGTATSTPQALGANLSPGAVALGVGVAQSSPVALGPSLAPGAVTLLLGQAQSVSQSYGVTLTSRILASAYPDPWNRCIVDGPGNQSVTAPSKNQTLVDFVGNQARVAPSVNEAAVAAASD